MKDISPAYLAKEEGVQRDPVELYHIWREGGEHWRYTSADQDIIYDSNTYVPATLKRGSVTYDSQLEVSTMSIQTPHITDPTIEYIAFNPIEAFWVEVLKGFRDFAEVVVIFVGQIKNVSFKGAAANVQCVGFEHFLKMPVPLLRYQITCNWHLFSTECSKLKADFKVTGTVTLDPTKTILNSGSFGILSSGYLTGGLVEFGDESRTIVAHTGSTITIAYKMQLLADGDSVDAYPGCDGRVETCRDKYDNVVNFLGFPFIPIENPAIRVP